MSLRRLVLTLALPAALAACGESPAPAPATAPAEKPAAGAPDAPAAPAAGAVGIRPGDRIPAFTAEGTSAGAAAKVASQEPGAVTVYCAGSTTCPYTNKYAAKMQSLEAEFAAKGVKFVWLYPNRTESDADKTAWHAEKSLAGTFVIDRDAAIAKTLGVKRTPELIVTKADGTITYRGAIDDGGGDPKRAKTEYLADAIRATLSGGAVQTAETTPAG